jgi:sugar lactone lactonase YvrE
VNSAFDATPDPDGVELYFTGIDPVKGAGVFKAKADGSDPAAVEVHAGDPFVSPFGITIGTDGKQLYVADPGAESANDHGQIFVLPIGGGAPAALAGTADFLPRSVEIGQENGKDLLFFTGTDPADGKPGVFKISISGGTALTVSKDALFRDPSGIVVAKNGDVYVVDTQAAASGHASVLKVTSNGAAQEVIGELRVGYPPGIALTLDEKSLLVSGLDPLTLNDVLINFDMTDKTQTLLNDVIGSYSESAGLHRAKNKNLFAWADSSAGPKGGKVFVVK